jgi:hypothetical protein
MPKTATKTKNITVHSESGSRLDGGGDQVSDITDIVSRLRRTDENRGVAICSEAADTIEQLRKERDEARRYSCDLEARIIVLEEDRRDTSNKFGTNPCSEIILPDYPLAREPKEIAKQKGWDCFKENTNE